MAESGDRFDRRDRRRIGAAWDEAGTCLAGKVAAAGDAAAGSDPGQNQNRSAVMDEA